MAFELPFIICIVFLAGNPFDGSFVVCQGDIPTKAKKFLCGGKGSDQKVFIKCASYIC